jgi:hypothetical protein
MKHAKQQDQSNLKWVADFIWNIADDRLRDVYVRGKYRDVILPFTVLRRLDAVLESTKQPVLERKKFLDTHKVAEQDERRAQRGYTRQYAAAAIYRGLDRGEATTKGSPSCTRSSVWEARRPCSRSPDARPPRMRGRPRRAQFHGLRRRGRALLQWPQVPGRRPAPRPPGA